MARTTLIDPATLRERYDIHRDRKEGMLLMAIRSASRRTRKWVGDAVYADALLSEPDTPTDEDRALACADVEACLAMHYLVLPFNTHIREQGVVAEEKLAEGGTVVRFLNPQAINDLAEQYLCQAKMIVELYDLSAPVSTFEFVELEDA